MPTHCPKCALERGIAIPANCPHITPERIDGAIKMMERLADGLPVYTLLVNYLKANADDIKGFAEDME